VVGQLKAGALLAPGEALETPRLTVKLAGPKDLELLAWLGGALAPDWTPQDLAPHVGAGEAVVICVRDGGRIGIGVVLRGLPTPATASVPFIAIAPPERYRGLGGEAVLALERLVQARWQVERVLAPVPERRGLAVYFWLRLGYRPLQRVEALWPLVGLNGRAGPGIWMGRDLSDGGPAG
jgi:ribosomal protein S18 acetylase RimI-like enzyme